MHSLQTDKTTYLQTKLKTSTYTFIQINTNVKKMITIISSQSKLQPFQVFHSKNKIKRNPVWILQRKCATTTVSERRKRARARPDKTEDRMEGGEEDITPGYITFHVQGVGERREKQENPRTLQLTHCLVYLQKPITICTNTVIAKSFLSHVLFTLTNYTHLQTFQRNQFLISILSLLKALKND